MLIVLAAVLGASISAEIVPAASQESSPSAGHPQPGITGQLVVGKADFDEYCAGCHGANGAGNGSTTNVIPGIKPADLTKIAAANGGVFPAEKVADMIDGRRQIPSHQRFDMPFWGVNFQQPGGKEFTPESEAKARARIDMIVSYIKTMQTK
jgi:hypothetical protein